MAKRGRKKKTDEQVAQSDRDVQPDIQPEPEVNVIGDEPKIDPEPNVPDNPRWKTAAANAAAMLPRGYLPVSGFGPQDLFYRTIASFGENADAAAVVLQSASMANMIDSNRRGGAGAVVADLKRQMEFITGRNVTAERLSGIGVVSVDSKPEADADEQSENLVNVID